MPRHSRSRSYNVALAYPGNAYVNVIGLDAYDQAWVTPLTPANAWNEATLPALTAARSSPPRTASLSPSASGARPSVPTATGSATTRSTSPTWSPGCGTRPTMWPSRRTSTTTDGARIRSSPEDDFREPRRLPGRLQTNARYAQKFSPGRTTQRAHGVLWPRWSSSAGIGVGWTTRQKEQWAHAPRSPPEGASARHPAHWPPRQEWARSDAPRAWLR